MSRSRTAPTLLVFVTSVAVALTGCAMQEAPPPTPSSTTQQDEQPDLAESPVFYEGGSAEQNLPYFEAQLRKFAAGTEAVQGMPLVNVLADSGFDKGQMQVSFDQSKTGLTADSIFVAVRVDADCLIGQIASASREIAAEVMPAVGPNRDICLIGNTRPIDW